MKRSLIKLRIYLLTASVLCRIAAVWVAEAWRAVRKKR